MVRQARQKPRTAKTAGKDAVSRTVVGRDTGTRLPSLEKRLREAEDKFRNVFMSAPVGLNIATLREGLIIDSNPAFLKIFGYSRDEVVGHYARDIGIWVNYAERERVVAEFEEMGSVSREIIARRKSGEEFPCLLSASTAMLLGEVECTIAVVQDLTERKKAEGMLKQSEQKFRNFFQNVMDACYMVSPGGKILDANSQASKLTGYGRDELIGSPLETLYAPESVPKFRQLFRHWLRTGTVSNEEMTVLTRSGQKRQVLVNVGAVRDADGRILYSTSAHTDITDRIEVERELKGSQLALRNLAKSLELARENEKKIIAREIHDELGQLMTALKMDIAWISSRLTADQKALRRKTQSMLELATEGIQSVKRISAELRPRILDELGLAAAVEWQLDNFAKHAGVRCRASISPADPAVDNDISTVIFRVFQEALTNVARHSKATAVRVSLKVDRGELVLQVRDNGVGVSPTKVSNPHSSGLIGMRERLLAIGGDLRVHGVKGRGTTLTASVKLNGTGGLSVD